MKRYNPKEIEPRWQQVWAEQELYKADLGSSKPKYIGFGMFNYPSGAGIHIGHGKNFTLPDVILRAKRQQGYETYSPVGFDSFGLPAENYAIKTGTSPRVTTDNAIANYRKQYRAMGWSQDWSREIDTSQPEYYRWTQWIFTKLFEHNLAYQKRSLQWWCPHDKTVLANEQVEGGKCWRCGNEVVKKSMKQWFFKITEYADEILKAIDDLDWTESVKTMQKNWIGRSTGAEIRFTVDGHKDSISVFTTRPDTLYGATFLVLAPEHPLLEQLCTPEQRDAAVSYRDEAVKKSEVQRQENKQKTGVFTGAYAVNPLSGEKTPIWTADYVLMGYGTGAIMAVPAHDERDYAFAKQFELPITFVVEPTYGVAQGDDVQSEKVFVVLRNPKNDTVVVLDWGPRMKNYGGNMLIGGTVEDGEAHAAAAVREIAEETGYKNIRLIKEAEFKGHGYFYSNPKNLNVHASGKAFLYDLVDEEQSELNLDAGEQNKFSLSWQPISKVASMLDDGVHEALFRYLVFGECYHGEGVLVNSGNYDGISTSEAREKMLLILKNKALPA